MSDWWTWLGKSKGSGPMRYEFKSEYGYTSPDGLMGVAFPLPVSAEIDPATTAIPVFVVYPSASNPGSFSQTVATITTGAPGVHNTFFRVADYAKPAGLVTV